jgi:hypothetical protein
MPNLANGRWAPSKEDAMRFLIGAAVIFIFFGTVAWLADRIER